MAVIRSPEEWRQLLTEQAVSGLSVGAFCRQHSLSPSGFYRQQRKDRDPTGDAKRVKPHQAFVPVTIPRQAPAAIRLSVGRTEIAVSSAVAPDWVAALVIALSKGA